MPSWSEQSPLFHHRQIFRKGKPMGDGTRLEAERGANPLRVRLPSLPLKLVITALLWLPTLGRTSRWVTALGC
ncbi:MAG: hypothetical protein EP343_22085 [Deltaproteobacteria bacterium]|nr:MAG: hypothetical protein EP343_22085 [Deltaproteobacteria bacterium]